MRFKRWLIGAIIIFMGLTGDVCAIPVNAEAVYQDPGTSAVRKPSGYPDEMSAMPCCNIPEKSEPEVAHYTVDGQLMSKDMQDYIYRVCVELGIEWYYPYFLCQIFQESGFDPYDVSSNGLDYGYCQLRILYHEDFKAMVGHPEWDLINDPFANVYVGCYLMAQNLNESGGDISAALKLYFNSGSDYWNSKYVEDVLQWTAYLERIN